MRKLVLIALVNIYVIFSAKSQTDSLETAIFISPILPIALSDSLDIDSDILLLNGTNEDYIYSFYVSGYDTAAIDVIDLSFLCLDDNELIEVTYTLDQISSNTSLIKSYNSAVLPLGVHKYHDDYEFTVELKDSTGILLWTQTSHIEQPSQN